MSWPLMFMSPYQQQSNFGDRVPSRVIAAMQFLSQLTDKTRPQIAVGTVGEPCEFDGQELSNYELDARNAACKLVEDYFNGAMKMDTWEKKSEIVHHEEGKGSILNCHACAARGQTDYGKICKVCE